MILTAAALRQRFVAFVAERRPFALSVALERFLPSEGDIEQAVRRLAED